MIIKSFLYFFTRPLAKIIDLFNKEKRDTIKLRKEIIRKINKRDFVEMTTNILFEQNVIFSPETNPELLRLSCYLKAEDIFQDKKNKKEIDDLNIFIK